MFDNHDRVKFNNNNIVTEGRKRKTELHQSQLCDVSQEKTGAEQTLCSFSQVVNKFIYNFAKTNTIKILDLGN